MTSVDEILQILQDGKFHSGEEIANSLKVSRSTIWKLINKIRDDYHLEVFSVSGRGYKLPRALPLLSINSINQMLPDASRMQMKIELFAQLDSTNQYLLNTTSIEGQLKVCIAEMQTAGRGRRGRHWVSPFGHNLYLSVCSLINQPMSRIAGLSLAAGIAVARTMRFFGVAEVALKWPNDVHVNGHKIAGLLLEVRGETEGPVKVVMGFGINFYLPRATRQTIEQPVTDMQEVCQDQCPERNTFVARLLVELQQLIDEFLQQGISRIIEHWYAFDLYRDKAVTIIAGDKQIQGIYRGLNAAGEILLENENGTKSYNAGEVSLRG